MSSVHTQFLVDLVNLPTAPFVETQVLQYIGSFVAKRPPLTIRRDQFGNVLVTYRPPKRLRMKGRPVLFAAHMDHPGFIATEQIDDRHVRADWRGWVQYPYFAGERVQFFSAGAWVKGRITDVIRMNKKELAQRAATSARSFGADAPPSAVVVRLAGGSVAPGSPGMWALSDAVIRKRQIFARACDDLAGLAGILSMLHELCRRKSRVPAYAFFTRAEEVGFAGALAAVSARTVPQDALVVAVECSKAITGVALGDGPVLRVGDKASVFTPAATAYCQVVAEEQAKKDKSFRYQRKLMDGGTCESTAYCHHGYDATGICLPLVNYHNMDGKKIAPESVHVDDYLNLVKWFVALAESAATTPFDGTHPGLGRRLDALLKEHRDRLLKTAAAV